MNFKSLILIILISTNLFAHSDKLEIYSKIALKTLFYDFDFREKLFDNKIHFAIVYSEINQKKALNLKKYLIKNAQRLNNLSIEVILIDENELFKLNNVSCIYLFNIKDDNLEAILNYASSHKIITFTSNPKYLKKGVDILFNYQKEIEIFINREAIQKSNIKFKSTFLKATKIYNDK